MKKTLSALLLGIVVTLTGCELHENIDVSIKRKAIVHLVYHYDNGRQQTLDDVENIRLLIYDNRTGMLYRDTTLRREEFLRDTGAMQTYISRGDYSFVSWANIGSRTTFEAGNYATTRLETDEQGADELMYGVCSTPVVKGDSLHMDIHFFKSVFKINVRVTGLRELPYAEEHYFGIMNRTCLDMHNRPTDEMRRLCPALTYEQGVLSGSFYTPFFTPDTPLTVGVYCDNPACGYTTLYETDIQEFADYAEKMLGRDVEINVDIAIHSSGTTIRVSDWEGRIIQDQQFGI